MGDLIDLAVAHFHPNQDDEWHEHIWTVVQAMCESRSIDPLPFLEEAISAALTEGDLGSLGAGPIEDWIGGEMSDDLEAEVLERIKVGPRWAYAVIMARGLMAERCESIVKDVWQDGLEAAVKEPICTLHSKTEFQERLVQLEQAIKLKTKNWCSTNNPQCLIKMAQLQRDRREIRKILENMAER